MNPATRATALAIAAAFAAIYLIWGTTFLANALMIRALPPLLGSGLRFLLAGLLLYGWLRLRAPRPLQGLPWPRMLVCGVLFFTGGNGLLVWSQQGVPSGIAALVTAGIPLVVLLLDWALFARRAPAARRALGIVIGLCGVAVAMAQTPANTGGVPGWRVLALAASVVCWSAGTLVYAAARLPVSRALPAACAQMLLGGALLLGLGTLCGEWRLFAPASVNMGSWLALAYLVIVGSIVAMGCYLWLLAHVSAQQVATYALVNPLVAVVLGAWVLHETLSGAIGAALLLVLAGVALVLWTPGVRAADG
ncbi:MAG: EamA family transporter [Steroidobacteraceae bacterium]